MSFFGKVNAEAKIKNAFNADASDKVAQREAARIKAKKATVRDGSLRENEASKKLSKVDREIIKTVAKDLGLSASVAEKIVVASKNGVEYEADARHRDGELTLTGARPVFRLVLHEAGHRMEQFATNEWNVLADALYERAERLDRKIELGVTESLEFDKVKKQHDEAGIEKDMGGYFGEVVMNELEAIFGSAKEFNSWVSETKSDRKVKNAFRRLMDYFSALAGRIGRCLSGRRMSKDARARMRTEYSELQRIRELYSKAYRATERAVADKRNEVENSQNLGGTSSSKNYNVSTSHSLKNELRKDNENIDITSEVTGLGKEDRLQQNSGDQGSYTGFDEKNDGGRIQGLYEERYSGTGESNLGNISRGFDRIRRHLEKFGISGQKNNIPKKEAGKYIHAKDFIDKFSKAGFDVIDIDDVLYAQTI